MTSVVQLSGLADWQVNGFNGIDFNRPELTVDQVRTVSESLAAEGVLYYMPTIITNDVGVIEHLITVIAQAARTFGDHAADGVRLARIVGLHLEGPFISPLDGARGAHPRRFVRAPDIRRLERWQELADGMIRLLTLSPEWPDTDRFVKQACKLGMRVAIGHTLATSEQIAAAVAGGATLSTHLGNGLPTMLPRHPNPVWDQLAQPELWASVIADGFHLPRPVFDVFRQVKGERFFLVSDCTEFTGMSPGRYKSPIGGDVVLTAEGRLHLADNEQLLAGSAMSLRQIVAKVVADGWLSLGQAVDMTTVRPWRFLGEEPPTEQTYCAANNI
jgi:N-acetylglucosamine-6-phosphate deacetylase